MLTSSADSRGLRSMFRTPSRLRWRNIFWPMAPNLLVQALLGGLSQGAILGLIALGFSLVAGTVRVLHFAHGDIAIATVFVGVLCVLGRIPSAADLAPTPAVLFVLLTVAVGAVLS